MGMHFHHWFEDDTEEDRSIKLTKQHLEESTKESQKYAEEQRKRNTPQVIAVINKVKEINTKNKEFWKQQNNDLVLQQVHVGKN